MYIKILKESGYAEAMFGLSLSKKQPLANMPKVADKLVGKEGGHNKFLESIVVWLDITAPRYWWQQFDTYRVGTTKQSESTMHTITKRPITQNDFMYFISKDTLTRLNWLVEDGNLERLKNELPEGFLQRRVVCTNYKVLRNMYKQRVNHKLVEWQLFCDTLIENLEFFNWIQC